MRCKPEINEFLEIILGSKYSVSELVSVLLAIRDFEPVGRTMLSRILGLGDKKTRNLVKALEALGLVRVTRAGSSLTSRASMFLRLIKCFDSHGFTVSLVPCDISDVNILLLRDKLIMLLGDPTLLVAIGYSSNSRIEFPGVPLGLQNELSNIVKEFTGAGNEAIALFGARKCYVCCSSFLQALIVSPRRSATISRSL